MPSQVIPVRGVGSAGINRDTPSVLLPATAWSDGRNVRFDNESVSKITGHESMYDLAVNPLLLHFWNRPETQFYIFTDATTASRIDSSGNVSQIGSGYTSTGVWQATNFNGGYTVITNNGVEKPQYITYGVSGAVQETTLQDLPDWPDGLSAKVVRSSGYALIAGNFTDTSGTFTEERAGTIRISSQAAPGNVPSSWTVGPELLTTADEFELSTSSAIIDMVDLRGYTLVFTEDGIYRVTLPAIGRETRVQTLNVGKGALAIDCVIELDGAIFAVDRNDIYVTDGSGQIESVVDEKMRDYFFSNLNPTHYANTIVRRNLPQDEIWIMYPTLTSTGECNEALIWNYHKNTWTIRDMPNTRGATFGPRRDGNNFTMGSWNLIFNGYGTEATSTDTSFVHVADRTNQFNGENFTAFAERKTLDMGDIGATKWVGKFYPIMQGTGSVTFNIQGTNKVGQVVDVSSVTDLNEVRPFNIASEYFIEPRSNGRFLNMRVSSSDNDSWTYAGYSLDTDVKDRR